MKRTQSRKPRAVAVNREEDVTLPEAMRRERVAKAELARLELAQRRGELIDKAVVGNEIFRLTRALRDRLLAIPARAAPSVAACGGDLVAIDVLLTQQIADALLAFSDDVARSPTGYPCPEQPGPG